MKKNRTRPILMTLLIAVTLLSITILPIDAATTSSKATYALIGARPNPVGVGQTVLIATGITDAITTGNGFTGVKTCLSLFSFSNGWG
jgi:hypothetical protein